MARTILETIQNATYELQLIIEKNADFRKIEITLVKNRLYNAVTLLNKGYGLETEVGPLVLKYRSVEDVPDIKEETTMLKSIENNLYNDDDVEKERINAWMEFFSSFGATECPKCSGEKKKE